MMDDVEDDDDVGPALSTNNLSDLKCIISIPRSAKALLSVNCRQLSIPPCKPQITMIIKHDHHRDQSQHHDYRAGPISMAPNVSQIWRLPFSKCGISIVQSPP